jgi:hypothetical protein
LEWLDVDLAELVARMLKLPACAPGYNSVFLFIDGRFTDANEISRTLQKYMSMFKQHQPVRMK